MRSFVLVLMALLVLVEGGMAQPPKKQRNPHIADTDPLPPDEQAKTFHLPPGFVIELVAAEPTIDKPINIAFDAMGRLWVTCSREYPFPAPPDQKPKDSVRILEDFGPNGRARKATVFADGLNIPIGVLPYRDGAIVHSIPNLWSLRDTDGDGKADTKNVLYAQIGSRDTHGMTGEFMLGLDGWIYCCHGFANNSTIKSLGDTSISLHSGNTYRIRPDGSRIEQWTWGQVNPFGLAFDPWGNLYSADCHTRPVYQLLKGGYYPSFGKPHDGLGFAPEMVRHDHGSTAIAGIAYYGDERFPAEFRDNVFIGNVVTNRINRDLVSWQGGTPEGIAKPDFVRSDDPWFRPVDIKLGPDGCLYVADFYNRIIGHYEVPLNHPGRDRERGRIWRIRYAGTDGNLPAPAMPNLAKADVPALVKALDDPNLIVRTFATELLVQKGKKVLADLGDGTSAAGAAHRLWVRERLKALPETAVAAAVGHADPLVRTHALRILAERGRATPGELVLARKVLNDASGQVRRAAAQVLGAHPAEGNVRPLLDLRHGVAAQDTHLVHVVRMAIRDQFKGVSLSKVDMSDWQERDWRTVADVCLGLPSLESAQFLRRHLERYEEPQERTRRMVHHIVRHGADTAGEEVLDWLAAKYTKNPAVQAGFLKTVQQARQERGAGLRKETLARAESLARTCLEAKDVGQIQAGIDLCATLNLSGRAPELAALVADGGRPEGLRANAATALLAVDAAKGTKSYGVLGSILVDEKEALGLRERVAQGLASVNRPAAHQVLIQVLEKVPARLQTTIALHMAGTPQGGEKLLQTVAAGKASPRLLRERAIELRLQQAKIKDLPQRIASLTRGLPTADKGLFELVRKRQDGFVAAKVDAARGLHVFKKHCAACHQVAGEGAKIAPQLDGIGIRGVERILEDLLDPSRNVDQAFRSTTLALKNGQFVSGLLLREEGKVLILADNQGKEVRVAGDQVEERTVSGLSPMPANFADQIPEGDFFDLLAFLLAQRAKD